MNIKSFVRLGILKCSEGVLRKILERRGLCGLWFYKGANFAEDFSQGHIGADTMTIQRPGSFRAISDGPNWPISAVFVEAINMPVFF